MSPREIEDGRVAERKIQGVRESEIESERERVGERATERVREG